MRIGSIVAACTSLLIVLACGGASSQHAGSTGASSATITQYQDLTASVQSAAVSYGVTMGGPAMTLGACAAAHDAYDAQVRPWISQMAQLSGAMDAYMEAHNGYGYADMACVAKAMLSELDAHRLVACTFPSLSGDQTEVSRHVGVMTSFTGHVYERCGQMLGGQYSWAPPAPTCGGTSGGAPTDPVALGERIFDTGIGTNGQPIARAGGYGMMMSGGCASCHGYDGLGRTMMMFTTPNITYANLTDPSGMLDPDGSRGPTYTDDLIRRAVTQGLDADGSPLSTIMPRWQLGDLDWADLLLFLKTLPTTVPSGGGGTPPPPPPASSGTIAGHAFMGGMKSGTMAAYAVNGGMMGALLGSSAVDASGDFSITLGGYAGAVMLRVSGGTFVDESTGTTMSMQSSEVLTSAVPSFTAGAAMSGVQVTPLTAMAQARAQNMAGGMIAANVLAANAGVGNYFNVGDILLTAPMDPAVAGSGAGADLSAKNYGMTIAAMSQYAHAVGMTYSSSGMFTALMRDASDGVMNGMMGTSQISMGGMGGMGGGMMGGYTMQANAGTSGLATAMAAFVGSSRNSSGVAIVDMQPLIDRLNTSNGVIP